MFGQGSATLFSLGNLLFLMTKMGCFYIIFSLLVNGIASREQLSVGKTLSGVNGH